jgi:putative hemolysin
MITPAVILIVALALSAFLTAAEVALFSLSDARVRGVVDQVNGDLARIRAQPRPLLMLLRLGHAIAAVAAGASAFVMGHLLWPVWGGPIAVFLAAAILVAMGDLWPRRLMPESGVRFAVGLAPAMLGLSRLLRPVLYPLERIAARVPESRLTSMSDITAAELRQLAALGQSEGAIDEHEGEIIERALLLEDTRVWDIMTPRVDIFAWQDALTLGEIAPQFGSVPYSRIPVYGDSVDDVTGVLYLRDAYQALIAGERDVPLRRLARQPLVVPGSLPLTRLLRDFQNRRIHLALVVDEYGGIDGLVTLEDVIEELVGEIEDETDVTEVSMIRISRNEIVAEGDTELREINHIFNTALPLLQHRSLNGYLMAELGRVPEPREKLERQGLEIEVLDASDTQVLRARITRLGPMTETAEAERREEEAGTGEESIREAGPVETDGPGTPVWGRRGSAGESPDD